MKIFVVGGAGYIGSVCSELLLNEGHDRDKSRRLPGPQFLVANGRLRTGFLLDINNRKSQIVHRAIPRVRQIILSAILLRHEFVDVIGDAMKLLCTNNEIYVR